MPRNYVLHEYLWIDAVGDIRSKTRVVYDKDDDFKTAGSLGLPNVNDLPIWSFDGSSTGQAHGYDSDIFLKPIFVCVDPFNNYDHHQSYFVLCECYNKDMTPHVTNMRSQCVEVAERAREFDVWFGQEQEAIIYDINTHNPVGWVDANTASVIHPEQGVFYCGLGGDRNFVRKVMEEHMALCLRAGLHIRGMNAEVANAQLEWQIGELSAVELGDELWMMRYIMGRVCENHGCYIVYDPKPLEPRDKYNGSGAHINVSTKKTRELKGEELEAEIVNICEKLKTKHMDHMLVYGDIERNKLRLTGNHETGSFDNFTYGDNNRGCSVRTQKGKVYFEDRRPSAEADPYLITSRIIRTICLDE